VAADAPLSTVQVHQSLIPLQRERHYPQQIHPLPHSPWMCLYLPRLSFPRRTTQSKQSLSFQMTIDGDPPTDAAHRPVLGAAFWSDGPAMLYVLRSQAGRPSRQPGRRVICDWEISLLDASRQLLAAKPKNSACSIVYVQAHGTIGFKRKLHSSCRHGKVFDSDIL